MNWNKITKIFFFMDLAPMSTANIIGSVISAYHVYEFLILPSRLGEKSFKKAKNSNSKEMASKILNVYECVLKHNKKTMLGILKSKL